MKTLELHYPMIQFLIITVIKSISLPSRRSTTVKIEICVIAEPCGARGGWPMKC